jgi:2-keto-4-pentenoate hydratase/2-oxohepta-3-ene-1,7-dioic acid hydratase in catechol pathway
VGAVNVEGELAVVIGRGTKGTTVETAFDYVQGYTVVNDVTNVDRKITLSGIGSLSNLVI